MERKKNPAGHRPDAAELAPKATGPDLTLHSRSVGALPIINAIIDRMELESILANYLPREDRRNKIKTATAISPPDTPIYRTVPSGACRT